MTEERTNPPLPNVPLPIPNSVAAGVLIEKEMANLVRNFAVLASK